MIIVVDTNILFSAFLSCNSSFHEILLNKKYQFIAPNFIFVELFKYKEKILKHSKLNENELLELINTTISCIRFISYEFISGENLGRAIDLCCDIDLKDAVFVALTLEFNAVLWTGDKRLIEGLSKKGFVNFFDISTFT